MAYKEEKVTAIAIPFVQLLVNISLYCMSSNFTAGRNGLYLPLWDRMKQKVKEEQQRVEMT